MRIAIPLPLAGARLAALAALAALGSFAGAGCIEAPGPGPDDVTAPPEPALCGDDTPVAASPLRRLTAAEVRASARALLGDDALVLDLDDDGGAAFTLLGVDKVHAAAEVLAAAAREQGEAFLACAGAAEDPACVDALLADFGERAFRRPLDEDERAWLTETFTALREEQTFEDSLYGVVEVILQSPQFLYHLEVGVADPSSPEGLPAGARRLTGHERASRLAFFLWGAPPDEELRAAAADGVLDEPDGVRVQAERMLADPRARARVARFFADLFQLDGTATHQPLLENPKDAERFPEYDEALRRASRAELEELALKVVLDDRGTFASLFESTDAFVTPELAALYGVALDEPGWVALPADERAGLLTRSAFLSSYSGAEVQSPIRRGVFIIENILCYELGDPPPNASDVPVTGGVAGDQVQTVRQDVDNKTVARGDECAACHSQINPMGFLLENYDAIGRWQTQEQHVDADGNAVLLDIDASGAMVDGSPLFGALELSHAVSTSEDARACFVRRWWEAARGRPFTGAETTSADACAVATTTRSFAADVSIHDMLLDIVTSDGFLFIRAPAEAGVQP